MIYHLMYIVGDEMLHTIMMKDELLEYIARMYLFDKLDKRRLELIKLNSIANTKLGVECI